MNKPCTDKILGLDENGFLDERKLPEPKINTAPINEDLSVWTTQQQGLMSQEYTGGYLAGQETRVRFFHEELDRYIAKGEAIEKPKI